MTLSDKINICITNDSGLSLYSNFERLDLDAFVVSGFFHGMLGVYKELFKSSGMYVESIDGDVRGNHFVIKEMGENTYIFAFDSSYTKDKAIYSSKIIIDSLKDLKFEDSLSGFRKMVDSRLNMLINDLGYKYTKALYEEAILNTERTKIYNLLKEDCLKINKNNYPIYYSKLKSLTDIYKKINDIFRYAEEYWPLFNEVF